MGVLIDETTDIDNAARVEAEAPPGMLEIRFYTTAPLSAETNQDIFDKLYAEGIDVRRVYTQKSDGLYYTGIIYNKEPVQDTISFLPLAVIPLIAFGGMLGLIGIGIFKLDEITNSISRLLLLGLGGMIILAVVLRKPLMAYAERR